MTTAVYPARAARAIGFLKSHSNDIDIFVEDTASPNMWLKLLRRYVPDNVKLNSVTPLGGRKEVLKACKADQGSGRRRLYIIDADMDLLLGTPKPRLKHLYRLRRYCVENYLISQDAVVSIISTLNPRISEADASRALNIHDWMNKNGALVRELFVSYAVSQSLLAEVTTVAFSCHRLFLDDGSSNFCPIKIRKRIFEVYLATARKAGISAVRERRNEITPKAANLSCDVFCSAKSYILPSLFEQAKRSGGFSVSSEAFKTLLATFANPSIDLFLKRRLVSI